MRGVVPLLGAVILMRCSSRPDPVREAGLLTDDDGNNVTIFGYGAVAVVGIGALALGVVAMAAWWMARRPSSTATPAQALQRRPGARAGSRFPPWVCLTRRYADRDRPDLSNLPPGETAINPETGEEFTKSQ